jgi:MFS-type transporter involved in bile tolerance (Atg22 family)
VLDQVGAFAGPLIVAAALAATGSYTTGFAVLAVPGIAALAVLGWLVRRVPDPARYENVAPAARGDAADRARLPAVFWRYAGFSALTMAGFATFGVVGYHLATRGLVAAAAVPVVYAVAMAADAAAAAGTGYAYDRWGVPVLAVLPLSAAAVPALAFTASAPVAVAGAVVWGAALGVQESTMRAVVADLVPAARRASAFGIFAGVYGAAWAAGGILVGLLYEVSYAAVVGFVAVAQAAALALLATIHGRRERA